MNHRDTESAEAVEAYAELNRLSHAIIGAAIEVYLKTTGHRLGLLINFNVPVLRDGVKRVIR